MNLSTKEAAKHMGISKNTLNNWRLDRSQQIPFLKLGTRVIYRSEDLDKYLESCRKEYPVTEKVITKKRKKKKVKNANA